MNSEKQNHYFFIGLGGIGMSALARYLKLRGHEVAGYDRIFTPLTDQLEAEGITIYDTKEFNEIPEQYRSKNTVVVYTPAVPTSHPLIKGYQDLGATIMKRAALLGQLSEHMKCIAIGGTHGKTTTCAILAHLLKHCGFEMTALIGGILLEEDTNFIHTGDKLLVVEADEYDRSFLQLDPNVLGITSIDVDHLDVYENETAFQEAFMEFAQMVPSQQRFINASVYFEGRRVGSQNCECHAQDIYIRDGRYNFTLSWQKELHEGFSMELPGRHNLSNALMAIAIAINEGAEINQLRDALVSFKGIKRRFNVRYKSDALTIVDDYAHHPTEISAAYSAGREMFPGQRDLVIFQPHLFTRTRDFMDGFVASLSQFQQIFLLDIYPAREEPIEGLNSDILASRIKRLTGQNNVRVIKKSDIMDVLKNSGARVAMMLGAGDIGAEVDSVVKVLEDEA